MESFLKFITDWAERAESAEYSPGKLAHACNVSDRHLRRFFLEQFEKSPRQWLNETRLSKAVILLREGCNCKEVAAKLHYREPGQFSREFLRFHGFRPSQLGQHSSARRRMSG